MKWMFRLSLEAFIIFVIDILLSSVCTTLFYTGVIPQNYTTCVLLALICQIVIIVLLVVSMIHKANKGFAPSDIAVSYLAVFAIFATLSIFMALINFEPYFTFVFLGHKLFSFGVLPRFVSALIVNLILGCVCVVIPMLCNKQNEAERIRRYLQDDNGLDS